MPVMHIVVPNHFLFMKFLDIQRECTTIGLNKNGQTNKAAL